MSMRFKDDAPVACDYCEDYAYAGQSYYIYNKLNFCCKECLGAYLAENTPGIISIYLNTAEDHELNYGDYLYDRQRDGDY